MPSVALSPMKPEGDGDGVRQTSSFSIAFSTLQSNWPNMNQIPSELEDPAQV